MQIQIAFVAGQAVTRLAGLEVEASHQVSLTRALGARRREGAQAVWDLKKRTRLRCSMLHATKYAPWLHAHAILPSIVSAYPYYPSIETGR